MGTRRAFHAPGELLLFVIVAVVCGYSAAARADDTGSAHPFQLGIGAYFTTDSQAQKYIHTVYRVEVEYDVTRRSVVPVSVYGGYGWGSNSPVNGVSLGYNMFWLGVQARTDSQVYAGLGVGGYGQTGSIAISGLSSASNTTGGVGGTIFVGADLTAHPHQFVTSGLGIRLGYNFLPRFEGLNSNGADFLITYRI